MSRAGAHCGCVQLRAIAEALTGPKVFTFTISLGLFDTSSLSLIRKQMGNGFTAQEPSPIRNNLLTEIALFLPSPVDPVCLTKKQ